MSCSGNNTPVTEDFLERSDLPGVYYSTIHEAINAVKNAYPTKLTQDVTINCIKLAKETRNPQDPNKLTNLRIWTAVLTNWNKDSLYSLTINGYNIYTISCYSLGGIRIENCDNIIFKGIKFVDYSNYIKSSSPEEVSAIYSVGNLESKNKNLVVWDCIFEGRYLHTNDVTYFANFAFDTKLTSNILIYKSIFNFAAAVSIKCSDVDVIDIKNSYLSSNIKRSDIAHEAICNITGAYFVKISDCTLDGSTLMEYGLTFVDVKEFLFERNMFYNFAATVLDISGTEITKITMNSCVFHNCINYYVLSYLKFLLRSEQEVSELNLFNNVFYMDGLGAYFQEAVSINSNVGILKNYNNIFIEKNVRVNAFIRITGTLNEYFSNNNIYKAVYHTSNTRFNAVKILSCLSYETLNNITENRNLEGFRAVGLDMNSTMLNSSFILLNIEENPSLGFEILSSLISIYLSNNSNKASFDFNYKINNVNTSIGAYNLNGASWNELTDTTDGYKGINLIDEVQFNNNAKYEYPSEDPLLIKANCLDRTKLLKFIITDSNNNSYLYIGNSVFLKVLCNLDVNGMYISNLLYDVDVIKQTV